MGDDWHCPIQTAPKVLQFKLQHLIGWGYKKTTLELNLLHWLFWIAHCSFLKISEESSELTVITCSVNSIRSTPLLSPKICHYHFLCSRHLQTLHWIFGQAIMVPLDRFIFLSHNRSSRESSYLLQISKNDNADVICCLLCISVNIFGTNWAQNFW